MGVEAGAVDGSAVAVDAGLAVGNGLTVWAASPPQPANKIRPAARMTNNTDVNAMQRFLLDWKGLCVKNLRTGPVAGFLNSKRFPFSAGLGDQYSNSSYHYHFTIITPLTQDRRRSTEPRFTAR